MLDPSKFARWILPVPTSVQYTFPFSTSKAMPTGVSNSETMVSILDPSKFAR